VDVTHRPHSERPIASRAVNRQTNASGNRFSPERDRGSDDKQRYRRHTESPLGARIPLWGNEATPADRRSCSVSTQTSP